MVRRGPTVQAKRRQHLKFDPLCYDNGSVPQGMLDRNIGINAY